MSEPVASRGPSSAMNEPSALDQAVTRLRRDVEAVTLDVEVLQARVAGTQRLLDAAAGTVPVASDYRAWELGLQRLDGAYRVAAKSIGDLAGSVEWQWIGQLRDGIGDLTREVAAAAQRHGTNPDWPTELRRLVAAAAAAIGDLAWQVADRLEAPTETARAMEMLGHNGRAVANAVPAESQAPSAAGQDAERSVGRRRSHARSPHEAAAPGTARRHGDGRSRGPYATAVQGTAVRTSAAATALSAAALRPPPPTSPPPPRPVPR